MLIFGGGGSGTTVVSGFGAGLLGRAVKTIDKRRLPPKLDYYRELLLMGILAKVCIPIPADFALVHYSSRVSLLG